MSAKNDITGDAIASKANSKSYRDNYENIFAKKAPENKVELDEAEKANFESMLKVREYKDRQTKSKR